MYYVFSVNNQKFFSFHDQNENENENVAFK